MEGHGALMPDGQILYDRWEYVDRNFGDAQGLWTVHPDGTNHAVYWGNNTPAPGGVIDARPIPPPPQTISDFGFRISDFRNQPPESGNQSAIRNPQSAGPGSGGTSPSRTQVTNPKSEIRNPKSGSGSSAFSAPATTGPGARWRSLTPGLDWTAARRSCAPGRPT
jgi:hypothetical protein